MKLEARAEVDENAQLFFSSHQVFPYLLLRELREPLHGFHIDHDAALDQQVEPVRPDLHSSKQYSDWKLPVNMNATKFKSDTQRPGVNRF